jgi:hypothetical protein
MQKFLDHLRDSAPGFRCCRPGTPDDELEHDVRVEHDLGESASSDELAVLRQTLGAGCDEFETLYAQHNGMILYAYGDDAGVCIYPIAELDARNVDWREWFGELDDDELWDFQRHGVAFGEIIASGNYFVWWQGKVYYSDHDDGDDEPYGNSLSEFLDRIAHDPAKFLEDAGCYTRYGKQQWIPGEYVSEMR